MKITTKEIVYVSLFSALTAIGAFLQIPLGPVPITLQTLFVLLSGFILGPKLGFLSQSVYILLGLIGLPIFAGMNGGLQVILKPSFGFIISFAISSFVVGYLTKNKKTLKTYLFAGVVGSVIMYVIGIPYMAFILNYVLGSGLSLKRILEIGFLLFIPGDILKIFIASTLGYRLVRSNLFHL